MLKTAGSYCVGDEISIADLALVPQVYNANRYTLWCAQNLQLDTLWFDYVLYTRLLFISLVGLDATRDKFVKLRASHVIVGCVQNIVAF